MVTQPTFEEFKLVELQVPPNRPKSAEGFSFEFELRSRMVKELGSSAKNYDTNKYTKVYGGGSCRRNETR